MTIKIRKAEIQDENVWDQYIVSHSQGTVFHLNAWKRVVEKTFNHRHNYLIAETEGEISGVFPMFEIKSILFGHFFVSIPFAEIGGVLADNDAIGEKLIEQAVMIQENSKSKYLEFRNRTEITGYQTKSLYYNFKKEISSENEENLLAIPRKSRAMVRNAIKKGLVSEHGHHLLDDFYTILAINYHRLGTPIFPKRFFRQFLVEFKDNAGILTVRTEKNELAAAVLYFTFKDQMIPYYAGSDFSHRRLGPNDFMYWELMKLAVEKGLRYFDYGRSKEGTGSFDFKRHWGFEPKPLSYQYHLAPGIELPNLSPANPKYQKKIETWRKMPHSLTKIIGPLIAKNLV